MITLLKAKPIRYIIKKEKEILVKELDLDFGQISITTYIFYKKKGFKSN